MLLWLTAIISLTISLLAKFLADSFLDERIPLLGSFAGLQYSLNPGVAFGIQFPPYVQTLLIGFALCLVILLAVRRPSPSRFHSIGFGLIIGGALGNIIDRLFDGYVTDFFQVGTFPIFNVADSCITVGVILLLVEMPIFRQERKG